MTRNSRQYLTDPISASTAMLFALFAFLSASAHAVVTNDVDVSALSAFGNKASGQTNNWFVSGIDSYSGGGNFRLAENGDYLLSPDFGNPIRRLVLEAKSSSLSGRRLAFIPWDGLVYDTARTEFCPFPPSADKYTLMEIELPPDSRFTRFKIALRAGTTTSWGVRRLSVITDGAGDEVPALAPLATNALGAVRLSSYIRNGKYVFAPPFAALAEIDGYVPLADGWFPPFAARAFTDNAPGDVLKVNDGQTQYQGHYVWTAETEGLGSYTSSDTGRSWQWKFANDTGVRLRIDAMTAVFGQWGARNSQPDTLTCEWEVSSSAGLTVRTQASPIPATDIYVSAYTNNQPGAQFPALERRELSHPKILRPGETLSVTFRDSCPAKGANAALGLAGLRLLADPSRQGTFFGAR